MRLRGKCLLYARLSLLPQSHHVRVLLLSCCFVYFHNNIVMRVRSIHHPRYYYIEPRDSRHQSKNFVVPTSSINRSNGQKGPDKKNAGTDPNDQYHAGIFHRVAVTTGNARREATTLPDSVLSCGRVGPRVRVLPHRAPRASRR